MLDYRPRDYQEIGVDLCLFEPGVLLAYEPGSGKTVTALTAASFLNMPTLVVAPKLVAQEVWTRETAKWRHLQHLDVFHIDTTVFDYQQRTTASVVSGGELREIILSKTMSQEDEEFVFLSDVVVTKRELLPRDWRATKAQILRNKAKLHVVSRDHLFALVRLLGHDWPYRLVIGDESTSFKNHDSQRSIAMRWLRRENLIERLILLSGTPSPRGIENLWSQALLLDGGTRLGSSLGKFRKQFMAPDSRDAKRIFSWRAKPGATDAVANRLKDICQAVRADVWRKTAPPLVVERFVTLPDSARAQYDEMAEECYLEIGDSEITASQAAVLSNKLLQMASGAVLDTDGNYHVIHDEKLDALEELLEELDGEPLIVVYWFKSTLDRLKKRFGKKLVTTKTKGFLDRFAAGVVPLLALQPGSAAHGLDGLQNGGHHITAIDLFHDWELFQQAVSRLDRSGQEHRVTVHMILADKTKDAQVGRVLADRGADQGRVMEAFRR